MAKRTRASRSARRPGGQGPNRTKKTSDAEPGSATPTDPEVSTAEDIGAATLVSTGVEIVLRADDPNGDDLTYDAYAAGKKPMLADAFLRGVDLPYVEVHISNLDRRGMRSLMAAEADGMIMGLGLDSYVLGLDAICRLIERRRQAGGEATP